MRKKTRKKNNHNLELQRDKAQDEAILSSIGEGLIATDKEGNIVLANPVAEDLLKWKPGEFIGKHLFNSQILVNGQGLAVSPEERPVYIALHQGKRVTTSAYSYRTKNGHLAACSITAAPIIYDGRIIGAIQVFRNIENEREIDRAKSELISLVSHQLRTPLSGINWYTEALVKEEVGKINATQKKYLQEVSKASKKLVNLVYDFLNVSRVELGTLNLKLSAVNIKTLSQEIIKELHPLIKEKKISISQTYSGKLAAIPADHRAIRLILQNLITNAIKYTPAKGKVSISIKLPDAKKTGHKPELFIKVADNGLRIPAKDKKKIFSKLFRADNIKTLDNDGTGLGLYLTKSFTELWGGKIWFKSKEKKGTSFFVTLPLVPNIKSFGQK